MAHYFFHIREASGFVEDEEGREFADLGAARAYAIMGARSIVSEDAKQGRIDLRALIEVTDNVGAIVLTIAFSDAIDLLKENGL